VPAGGVPLAGSITYAGSYTQTRSLRSRMLRWLERSGLRPGGPWREVYHRFGADQRGYRTPVACGWDPLTVARGRLVLSPRG